MEQNVVARPLQTRPAHHLPVFRIATPGHDLVSPAPEGSEHRCNHAGDKPVMHHTKIDRATTLAIGCAAGVRPSGRFAASGCEAASTRPSTRRRPGRAQKCAAAIFPPEDETREWSTNAASRGTYWSAEACLPGQTASGCPLPHSLLILLCFFALAFEARAEIGLASYYSYGNRGERGEMTCAHRTRSFGSLVTVTYSGRSIQCRVADRGPFIRGRIIDLSVKAARALGMMEAGVVRVSVE